VAESLVLAAAVEEADAERAAAIAAPSPSGGGAPENGAKPTASPAEGALASAGGGGPAGDGPAPENGAKPTASSAEGALASAGGGGAAGDGPALEESVNDPAWLNVEVILEWAHSLTAKEVRRLAGGDLVCGDDGELGDGELYKGAFGEVRLAVFLDRAFTGD